MNDPNVAAFKDCRLVHEGSALRGILLLSWLEVSFHAKLLKKMERSPKSIWPKRSPVSGGLSLTEEAQKLETQ